ncbi:MAG: FHA domain-containing protein [Sinobacteraceae bacterium]|nr:FHA domain-containing protein [Nevskiaceae bacterium]
MSTLGLVLDDAALALAVGDAAAPRVAPSIVDAGQGQPAHAGRSALARARSQPNAASSRHWFELAQGRPPARAALTIARAELAARLAEWPSPLPDRACVAVPAGFDGPALSRLLAVCRAAGLAVGSFVDAAALAAAALSLRPGTAIVLELGLHHAATTRVEVTATEARRRSTRLRLRGGWIALQESWLQLVSEAMVLKTRFDPLHDASTEQRLYDQLPAVTACAARDGSAAIGLTIGAGETALRHEVVLSRDQFAARGEALYRELIAMVHELRPAGMPVTLVVPTQFEQLPGWRELLDAEFPGCSLQRLPEGFLASAAAALGGREPVDASASASASAMAAATVPATMGTAAAAAAVPLRRGVPRFEPPLPWPDGPALDALPLGRSGHYAGGERPTHLLWSGRALPLAAATIEIGRAPAAGGIVLAEGLAGVSRLHCTLRDEAEAIVLVDHSRHGTWVNGERVAGRARLRAGDRLRIGDPGVELALIAVDGRNAQETPQR